MKVFGESDLNYIVICLVLLILLLCLYLEYDRMSITSLVKQSSRKDSFQTTSTKNNNNPLDDYFENEGNTTFQNIKMNVGGEDCFLRKVDSNLQLDFLRGNNKLAEFTCGEGAKQRGDVYKVEKSESIPRKYTIKDHNDCQLKMRRADDSIGWVDGTQGQRIVYFNCPNGTSSNSSSNDIGDFDLTGSDSSSFGLYAKIPK